MPTLVHSQIMTMKKLLLIEEDTDIREMVAFTLENNGFEIVRADKDITSGDAIQINPHVIIIGYSASNPGNKPCAELKANDLTNPIPVIVYSPNLEASKIGDKCADAVLAKPSELEDLVYLANRLAYKN